MAGVKIEASLVQSPPQTQIPRVDISPGFERLSNPRST
jgi:hypothetical protein